MFQLWQLIWKRCNSQSYLMFVLMIRKFQFLKLILFTWRSRTGNGKLQKSRLLQKKDLIGMAVLKMLLEIMLFLFLLHRDPSKKISGIITARNLMPKNSTIGPMGAWIL